MLRTIIQKDFLEKILTLRFVTALLLSLILITISVFVLSNDYAQELADYHTRVRLHTETRNLQLITVDRKPMPLTALFRGLTNDSAAAVQLSYRETPKNIEAIDDNPTFVLFPTIDLTFIIGIVMSLLAVLFAHDAISGERETGTLALMMSKPIQKPLLIIGKWLGGYLSLILPCLIGTLPGLLILSTHPLLQLSPADWGALGLILVGALLYLGCFFALGILISTLTTRSSTAILALLFLWVICVFVIPNISPYITKALSPIPSFTTHDRDKRLARIDIEEQKKREHDELAREIIDKRISNISVNPRVWELEGRLLTHQKEVLWRIESEYDRKIKQQERISTGLASLSPYACFTFFASRLAGSDSSSEVTFLKAVERFDEDYFPEGMDGYTAKWEEPPTFSYTEPTVSKRLKLGLAPLGLLLLFTVVFLVAGYAAFLRYDVQ